jgi:hypothetical protein
MSQSWKKADERSRSPVDEEYVGDKRPIWKTSNTKSKILLPSQPRIRRETVESAKSEPEEADGVSRSWRRRWLGLSLALLSAFFFSLIPLFTKLVPRIHPLGQTVWRQCVSILISLVLFIILALRGPKSRANLSRNLITYPEPDRGQIQAQDQDPPPVVSFQWKMAGLVTVSPGLISFYLFYINDFCVMGLN